MGSAVGCLAVTRPRQVRSAATQVGRAWASIRNRSYIAAHVWLAKAFGSVQKMTGAGLSCPNGV